MMMASETSTMKMRMETDILLTLLASASISIKIITINIIIQIRVLENPSGMTSMVTLSTMILMGISGNLSKMAQSCILTPR